MIRRSPWALGALLAAGMLLGIGAVAVTPAATTPAVAAAQGECTATNWIAETPTALNELQSESAWSRTRGSGVTVAVVDSGVAANPHLTEAVVGGINLVPDGTDPGGRTDLYGHGTAIAGQIAARLVPDSGVEGLAPDARILSVRVFAGTSDQLVEAGFGPSTARMSEGIRWAADQGAQIINVSMSTVGPDPGLAEAVAYATDRGSLVVSTAGNRDSSLAVEESGDDGVRYPAGFPQVLGVAATDSAGIVTDASIHGSHVRVAAPGQLVLTTSAAGADCVYAPEAPATSYAAGYVSAAAALVAAAHPQESPAQWAYRLEATAVRPDAGSRDDRAGWGVVQPWDAMTLIPGPGVRGPQSPFGDDPSAPPIAAESDAIRVVDDPGADAAAIAIGVTIGILGLVVLISLGALGVFVTRRADAASARPVRTGKGLYGDAPET